LASKAFLELDPAFLAARLLARHDGLAERVLDALDIDLDLVAGLQRAVLGLGAEFLQRDAALDLEAHIDDGHVLFDGVTFRTCRASARRCRTLSGESARPMSRSSRRSISASTSVVGLR
jgi:hypothetical protein